MRISIGEKGVIEKTVSFLLDEDCYMPGCSNVTFLEKLEEMDLKRINEEPRFLFCLPGK